MPNAKNVESYAAIKEDFQGATAVWAINYSGLVVKDAEALRRSIREAGGYMKVYKNALVKHAIAELELPNMDAILEGPSAFIFTGADVAAPAKVLADFAKENPAIALKGGIMDGAFQDVDATIKIASLPSREVLLGQIANALTSVGGQIAIAIGQMAEGEGTTEAA
jgi:large subunit ribosomal protein L10